MKDFRGVAEVYLKGSQQVRWTDIKCLKVEKAHPGSLFVKSRFGCKDYREIQFACKGVVEYDVSDHDVSVETDADDCCESVTGNCDQVERNTELPPLESESMVTLAKKNDLLWMCEQFIIPKDYHSFYKELSVCSQTDCESSLGTACSINSDVSTASSPKANTKALTSKAKALPLKANVLASEAKAKALTSETKAKALPFKAKAKVLTSKAKALPLKAKAKVLASEAKAKALTSETKAKALPFKAKAKAKAKA